MRGYQETQRGKLCNLPNVVEELALPSDMEGDFRLVDKNQCVLWRVKQKVIKKNQLMLLAGRQHVCWKFFAFSGSDTNPRWPSIYSCLN